VRAKQSISPAGPGLRSGRAGLVMGLDVTGQVGLCLKLSACVGPLPYGRRSVGSSSIRSVILSSFKHGGLLKMCPISGKIYRDSLINSWKFHDPTGPDFKLLYSH